MPRITIEPASQREDAEFRRILRENTPPGSIRVRYEREPDFLGGCRVEGTDLELAYAKDLNTGKLVGTCVRAIKPCYINGSVEPMGYLSSLRIEESHRNSFALIKFFRYLKTQHEKSGCKRDLMMITDGNHKVGKLLTSGRAGLPQAYPLGRLFTYSIGLQHLSGGNRLAGIEIRTLQQDEWDAWFAFLHHTAPFQRELFPAYEPEHLDPETGLLRGLTPDHIYVAWQNGQIVGTVSAWDQQAFKQFYIEGYAESIRLFRQVYNAYSRWTGKPLLPPVGDQLSSVFLGVICIAEDRKHIFARLLQRVREDLVSSKRYHSLMVGLHERDPLRPVVKRLPHVAYTSAAWLLAWEEMDELVIRLTQAIPYLELGAL